MRSSWRFYRTRRWPAYPRARCSACLGLATCSSARSSRRCAARAAREPGRRFDNVTPGAPPTDRAPRWSGPPAPARFPRWCSSTAARASRRSPSAGRAGSPSAATWPWWWTASARGASRATAGRGRTMPPITARFDDAFGALRYLQSRPDVRADRIAAIGWSQGGRLRHGGDQRPEPRARPRRGVACRLARGRLRRGASASIPGGCFSLVRRAGGPAAAGAHRRGRRLDARGQVPGDGRGHARRAAPTPRSSTYPGAYHYFDVEGQRHEVLAQVENDNRPGGFGATVVLPGGGRGGRPPPDRGVPGAGTSNGRAVTLTLRSGVASSGRARASVSRLTFHGRVGRARQASARLGGAHPRRGPRGPSLHPHPG